MTTNGPEPAQRGTAEEPTVSAWQVRLRYLIAGVVVGGLWFLNRDLPLWEHAVQMLIIMTVLTVVQAVRGRHNGAPASAYVRLLVVKWALIALAVVASWVLRKWVGDADTIVAVGLVVLVSVLGPVLDGSATRTRATPPAQSAPAWQPASNGQQALFGRPGTGSARRHRRLVLTGRHERRLAREALHRRAGYRHLQHQRGRLRHLCDLLIDRYQ